MAHEQDDHGFPLDPNCCPACLAVSIFRNNQFLTAILSPDGHDPEVSYRKPSHDKELPE